MSLKEKSKKSSKKDKAAKETSIKEELTQKDNSHSEKGGRLKHALTPDKVGIPTIDGMHHEVLVKDAHPKAGPLAKIAIDMKLAQKYKGYLVNGHESFPQFIPEDKMRKNKKNLPDFDIFTEGFILLNRENYAIFYPNSTYTFDKNGFDIDLNEARKAAFVAPENSVYNFWMQNRYEALAKRNAREKKLKDDAEKKKKEKGDAIAAAPVARVAGAVGAVVVTGAAAGAAATGAGAGAGTGAAAGATGGAGAGAGTGAKVGANAGVGTGAVAGGGAGAVAEGGAGTVAGGGASASAGAGAEVGAGVGAVAAAGAAVVAGAGASAGATADGAAASAGADAGAVGGAEAGPGAGTAAVAGAGDGAAGGADVPGAGAGAGVGAETGAGAGAVDEKKAENEAATTSKAEHTKSQLEEKPKTKSQWWKSCWCKCIACVILALVVAAVVVGALIAAGVIPGNTSGSSTEEMSQSNESLSNPMETNVSRGSGAGNLQSTSSTTPPTTTTTRAYPLMTAIQRVPVKELIKPTFEIVSSAFLLKIDSIQPFIGYLASKVTFVLKITSTTNVIQLHSDIRDVTDVYMDYLNKTMIDRISPYPYNTTSQLLTVNLPKPIHEGTMRIEISFTPAVKAAERMSVPCGQMKCSVYVTRKLSHLVPHFDTSTKHKWTINVEHPVGVNVVTNTKATSAGTSTRSTTFQETAPILPSELSIVIMENFGKQVSGTQVQYYLPSGTDVKEATGMVKTLSTGLSSKAKPSIPTGEMFFFIVMPAMENYQFCGRNVALVGTSLLRSNTEIQQKFVWNFIFRSVIYNKVTSADKKSSWVYEQSALFLSTSIKSTNKHLWKKHYYEIVMNSGHNDGTTRVNQAIVYEDERRYLDKRHHVAKVSTILAMLVTINNDTSTDALTVLDDVRNNGTSSQFFFIKSPLKLENGAPIDVDKVVSCYVDNPVTPRLHVNRTSPTHVAIQRSSGGQDDRCDMHLWLDKGQKNGRTGNKEHVLLSDKVDNIQVEADFPILLSGETPFSAYAYTMEQAEFDRLLDVAVLDSYDDSSVKMLASNAFDAAAEGILSYESLISFVKLLRSRNVLTVDEAVDLWMGPVVQSRNVEIMNLTEKLVVFVLNGTDPPSGSSVLSGSTYLVDRFDKAVNKAPTFEIENTASLIRRCGKKCYISVMTKYMANLLCVVNGEDCPYNPHILKMYVCAAVDSDGRDYAKFFDLYKVCKGKPCYLASLSGLLCSKDTNTLQSWLNTTTTLDTTDIVNRQVVRTIFEGLVSNEVSFPLMFPYFLENWHLIHKKFSSTPVLLGEIIEILASTITTSEQLIQYQQFVAFHGENLSMYREFGEQAAKAKKAIDWNEKFSKKFSQLFN